MMINDEMIASYRHCLSAVVFDRPDLEPPSYVRVKQVAWINPSPLELSRSRGGRCA